MKLKLLHRSLESTLKEGLAQTKDYVDKCGASEGHLLIFGRRPDKSWEEKLWRKEPEGIMVWGH